ncbi:TMEM175 family protein [Flavobacterium sp. SM15]|uniref:TMEM175 family protein n=1 Tax=Flavobacterium sp. SM15 TaxID=2908005 RepID=UPI001EDB8D57|nr:TMEM175 family protein [Flavobacterium sp. SM15]MCG2611542.1 TMEM175 family protein [Flavobacterium sp. SM15]
MNKNRLEAFSDGVLAIIITIMVLEFKIPEGIDFESLKPLFPKFLSYLMSFIYVGIYWNNHHHMMHTVKRISGAILWANLHLLFWLSLVPFTTAWIGETQFAKTPMMLYGIMLLMAAIAYYILQSQILKKHGPDSVLSQAIGSDFKGKMSPVLYTIGIISANFNTVISGIIYILVALMWLIPDNRIEKLIDSE